MDTHNSVTSSGLQALAAEVNSLAIQFKRFTNDLHGLGAFLLMYEQVKKNPQSISPF